MVPRSMPRLFLLRWTSRCSPLYNALPPFRPLRAAVTPSRASFRGFFACYWVVHTTGLVYRWLRILTHTPTPPPLVYLVRAFRTPHRTPRLTMPAAPWFCYHTVATTHTHPTPTTLLRFTCHAHLRYRSLVHFLYAHPTTHTYSLPHCLPLHAPYCLHTILLPPAHLHPAAALPAPRTTRYERLYGSDVGHSRLPTHCRQFIYNIAL